ncbi:putative proteasome maturation factor ump1 [Neolecta irregularis DAH-3]|uniref:Putative proteasome maturation factor ump1 n=1 Tax=Neolecta irregularis (strain DAH-3) TaxID=1198029 RepID=A0A1U7LVQ6_NEOID|nr:putative proteasome maturation factor ump1 [Neolecta irregularis DAH-3]|eukprot:OLL26708.1 putative proteasome maturation factor ump1 [Neolecta irregularis DAH-3]
MRIVPTSSAAEKVEITEGSNAVPAVHDTLRHGTMSLASKVNSRLDLESRLRDWNQTQLDLQMDSMRQVYGLHEPIRRGMEIDLTTDFWPATLGGPSNLHQDILLGRDTKLDVEDIFTGALLFKSSISLAR